MSRAMLLSLGLVLGLSVGTLRAGDDAQEALADKAIATFKEYAGVLESVKDKASAEAAKPKLEAINKKIKEIEAEGKKLGEPNEAIKKKLEESMGPAVGAVLKEMGRISENKELTEILGSTLSGGDEKAPAPSAAPEGGMK